MLRFRVYAQSSLLALSPVRTTNDTTSPTYTRIWEMTSMSPILKQTVRGNCRIAAYEQKSARNLQTDRLHFCWLPHHD
jgi:hypothetical protein